MGKGQKNSRLLLPMWLAEQEKSKKAAAQSNKFMAKSVAVFAGIISFQAAAFVIAVKFLPERHARVLCSSEICEKYSLTIMLCSLPPIILFGFVLNTALWFGIRKQKPVVLTVWMVVYEMLFYLQLFFQISNILPLPDMIKSADFLGFLKYWILPMVLLWLNNNAGQIVFRCREEIRDELEEAEKQRQKNLRHHHQSPQHFVARNPARSPGGHSHSSRGSGSLNSNSNHSNRTTPRNSMSEFGIKSMVLPKLTTSKRVPPRPPPRLSSFYRGRTFIGGRSDKYTLMP